MPEWDVVLIAGPTASGKSALALDLARKHGGVVVNADSMQVYDGLRVLTARPSEEDEARLPHHLYGHVDPADSYSAGAYLRDVAALLPALKAARQMPVFCGGTGLYLEALTGGLDDIPPIPEAIRARWRSRLDAEGPEALHDELRKVDPETAARLRRRDGQRIARALETFEATGIPLSKHHRGGGAPLLDPAHCLRLLVSPDRTLLRERIARRFAVMMEEGALDEVARFRERPGALEGPAGKAIGVRELSAVLDGEASEAEAVALAVTRTRQYAKRQETWMRNRFGAEWRRIPMGGEMDVPCALAHEAVDVGEGRA